MTTTTGPQVGVPPLQSLGFSKFLNKPWRDYQADVVSLIINSPKKFIIVEAPTGFGKSPAAMAASRLLPSVKTGRLDKHGDSIEAWQASTLTATKQLMAQYITDFPEAKEVKGRQNFPCTIERVTAGDALCTVLDLAAVDEQYHCVTECPYYRQKRIAAASPLVIHNYAYYLASSNYTHSFVDQKLLVLDETHLLDDMLMGFISSSARRTTCDRFNVTLPEADNRWTWRQWQQWASAYLDDVAEQLSAMSRYIETDVVARRNYKAGEALKKTMLFLSLAEAPWVAVKAADGFDFMPVWIGQYADKALYSHAEKVVCFSATILDPNTFCTVAGIPPDQADFMSVPSTFPVGSRPIYYAPAMDVKGGQHDDGYFQPLLDATYQTIREHEGDKGLIHCVSYDIAKQVVQHAPPDIKGRLVTHQASDRLAQYEQFRQRTDDAVLVSPSMKEGISLEDNQCRFIVVCKVPFPYLGSPQVKARMDSPAGRQWYAWKTMCDLIQMTGRGMRSETDHCAVYILDGNFRRVFLQMRQHVPSYWKDDLIDVYGALNS